MQGVIPMISYADGVAALDWLSKAFGFREVMRMLGENGKLAHGEMETGDGVIMLATPTPDYEGPKRHREHCDAARKWSTVPWVIDGVLVYVDDVAAHCERAKREGASILSEPETDPHGTRYRVEDFEGHRWMFAQRAAARSTRKKRPPVSLLPDDPVQPKALAPPRKGKVNDA